MSCVRPHGMRAPNFFTSRYHCLMALGHTRISFHFLFLFFLVSTSAGPTPPTSRTTSPQPQHYRVRTRRPSTRPCHLNMVATPSFDPAPPSRHGCHRHVAAASMRSPPPLQHTTTPPPSPPFSTSPHRRCLDTVATATATSTPLTRSHVDVPHRHGSIGTTQSPRKPVAATATSTPPPVLTRPFSPSLSQSCAWPDCRRGPVAEDAVPTRLAPTQLPPTIASTPPRWHGSTGTTQPPRKPVAAGGSSGGEWIELETCDPQLAILLFLNAAHLKQSLLLLPLNHSQSAVGIRITNFMLSLTILTHSKQPLLLLPLNHSSSHHQHQSHPGSLKAQQAFVLQTVAFSLPVLVSLATLTPPSKSFIFSSPAPVSPIQDVPFLQEHAECHVARVYCLLQAYLPSLSHLLPLFPPILFAEWLYDPCTPYLEVPIDIPPQMLGIHKSPSVHENVSTFGQRIGGWGKFPQSDADIDTTNDLAPIATASATAAKLMVS
ncbi:hypothetical protein EDB85DRAFT_2284601 [Lactarius pseudohatsudake]|nr:hypothetical protein EDB85DRAFT_2284601 [Lactarius pseudohatsudake]